MPTPLDQQDAGPSLEHPFYLEAAHGAPEASVPINSSFMNASSPMPVLDSGAPRPGLSLETIGDYRGASAHRCASPPFQVALTIRVS
jgi:hypothetical protein